MDTGQALRTILVFVGLSAGSSLAQPTGSLQVQAQAQDRAIVFTLVQNDLPSMEGCHYNLFAAERRRHLAELPGKGLSIATFYRALALVQIIASPLERLAPVKEHRGSRGDNRSIFFRTLLSCPGGTNGTGEIIKLQLATHAHGRIRRIPRLLRAMKNHMQYYSP